MNRSHNSRQVAKCPTNLVHGIAGTKTSARYDLPISDFKSQLVYSQGLGRGLLLIGEKYLTALIIDYDFDIYNYCSSFAGSGADLFPHCGQVQHHR